MEFADPLHARLAGAVSKTGIDKRLKSELRFRLIESLQKDGTCAAPRAEVKGSSLIERALLSLVLEFLKQKEKFYSLSVLLPECGLGPENVMSREEIGQVLSLHRVPAFLKCCADGGGALLELLLLALADMAKPLVSTQATQTDDCSVGQSLEAKLEACKGRADPFADRVATEERMLQFQARCEARCRKEAEAEIARIRTVERERIAMEEAAKCRLDMQESVQQASKELREKEQRFREKERAALDRLRAKEVELEKRAVEWRAEAARQVEEGLQRQHLRARQLELEEQRVKAESYSLEHKQISLQQREQRISQDSHRKTTQQDQIAAIDPSYEFRLRQEAEELGSLRKKVQELTELVASKEHAAVEHQLQASIKEQAALDQLKQKQLELQEQQLKANAAAIELREKEQQLREKERAALEGLRAKAAEQEKRAVEWREETSRLVEEGLKRQQIRARQLELEEQRVKAENHALEQRQISLQQREQQLSEETLKKRLQQNPAIDSSYDSRFRQEPEEVGSLRRKVQELTERVASQEHAALEQRYTTDRTTLDPLKQMQLELQDQQLRREAEEVGSLRRKVQDLSEVVASQEHAALEQQRQARDRAALDQEKQKQLELQEQQLRQEVEKVGSLHKKVQELSTVVASQESAAKEHQQQTKDQETLEQQKQRHRELQEQQWRQEAEEVGSLRKKVQEFSELAASQEQAAFEHQQRQAQDRPAPDQQIQSRPEPLLQAKVARIEQEHALEQELHDQEGYGCKDTPAPDDLSLSALLASQEPVRLEPQAGGQAAVDQLLQGQAQSQEQQLHAKDGKDTGVSDDLSLSTLLVSQEPARLEPQARGQAGQQPQARDQPGVDQLPRVQAQSHEQQLREQEREVCNDTGASDDLSLGALLASQEPAGLHQPPEAREQAGSAPAAPVVLEKEQQAADQADGNQLRQGEQDLQSDVAGIEQQDQKLTEIEVLEEMSVSDDLGDLLVYQEDVVFQSQPQAEEPVGFHQLSQRQQESRGHHLHTDGTASAEQREWKPSEQEREASEHSRAADPELEHKGKMENHTSVDQQNDWQVERTEQQPQANVAASGQQEPKLTDIEVLEDVSVSDHDSDDLSGLLESQAPAALRPQQGKDLQDFDQLQELHPESQHLPEEAREVREDSHASDEPMVLVSSPERASQASDQRSDGEASPQQASDQLSDQVASLEQASDHLSEPGATLEHASGEISEPAETFASEKGSARKRQEHEQQLQANVSAIEHERVWVEQEMEVWESSSSASSDPWA